MFAAVIVLYWMVFSHCKEAMVILQGGDCYSNEQAHELLVLSFHMLKNTNLLHCGISHQSNTRKMYCYCMLSSFFSFISMSFTAQATRASSALSVPLFCLHSIGAWADRPDPIWRIVFIYRHSVQG